MERWAGDVGTGAVLMGGDGRPSDSSTPGNEEPDTDISPKNKRSRVIFVDPTESPQVSKRTEFIHDLS